MVGLLWFVILVATHGFAGAGGYWSITWLATLAVGSVIFARAPGHPVGTILFASGVLMVLSANQTPLESYSAAPWLASAAVALSTFSVPLIMVSLLRFPTGRLLGPRWRWAEVFAVVVLVVGATAAFINNAWGGDIEQAIGHEGPLRDDFGWLGDTLSAAFFPGFLAVCVLGLVSVTIRYRRGTARERTQIRWLLFAVTVMVVMIAVINILFSSVNSSTHWTAAAVGGSIALVPVAIGVAIVRHQLFDIDVVISRTLVYASMLAVIAGIYVVVVFGVGSLIGQAGDGSPLLPVVATALVAIVFHPARVRLERLANRIVFGRRATPYDVLSEFTQRVAATDDELLVDVARSLADGTIATSATVWTVHDDRLEPVSVWPDGQGVGATTVVRAEDSGRLLVPGVDETYPIRHDGEIVGVLGLSVPTGESLPPADQALIGELAAGIGLALWNRQLTKELQRNVDDLRASRRRLVAIQDDTRHTLERDLHDGAQQRLVAVKVRLSIAQQMAANTGDDGRADRLAALCVEADEAIESLRDFARGVYPPLLEAEGLRIALEAHASRSRLPIEVGATVGQRQQREIEATVYFCVVQTLALIERSCTANAVEITLTDEQGRLAFEVRADHAGTSAVELPDLVRDRMEAVDGVLAYETSAGTTIVAGSVPIAAASQSPLVAPAETGELIDR